jgi:hypothetical protein
MELAWRLALCRPPRPAELAAMNSFCAQEVSRLIAEAAAENRELAEADAEQTALVQMCRVILNLNEFVYSE